MKCCSVVTLCALYNVTTAIASRGLGGLRCTVMGLCNQGTTGMAGTMLRVLQLILLVPWPSARQILQLTHNIVHIPPTQNSMLNCWLVLVTWNCQPNTNLHLVSSSLISHLVPVQTCHKFIFMERTRKSLVHWQVACVCSGVVLRDVMCFRFN